MLVSGGRFFRTEKVFIIFFDNNDMAKNDIGKKLLFICIANYNLQKKVTALSSSAKNKMIFNF